LYKGLDTLSFYHKIKRTVWESIGEKLFKERHSLLFDLMKKNVNFKLLLNSYSLDIGCGHGQLTHKISSIYGVETVGVDLGKSFVLKDRIHFMVADADALPFNSKSFAVVTAFSVIEHIHEDLRKKFYEEVKRSLADGGIFIIQLPNRFFPIEQHSYLPLIGYLPAKFHSFFFQSYVSVPSKSKLTKDLIKQGFKVNVIGYGAPFSSFLKSGLLSRILPFGFLIISMKD
jgi:SAM-dependent methyltransferase